MTTDNHISRAERAAYVTQMVRVYLDVAAAKRNSGYTNAEAALDLVRAILTYREIIAEIKADILKPKPIIKSTTLVRNLRNEINRYAASLARAIGGY